MKNARLKQIVDSFYDKKIAVTGDLILDVYIRGNANRISPEAPIPVVHVTKQSQCLGGAANVMRNIVTLGGKAEAFGVTGNDEKAEAMKNLLAEYGIAHHGVVKDPSRRTIEKQRVIASSQQLLRIDYEDISPVAAAIRETMADNILDLIARRAVDAVIFEDYAKGLLEQSMVQRIADAAAEAGIITALDPNPGNPMLIKNLTVMKPNRPEAYAMAGKIASQNIVPPEEDRSLTEVAEILLERWRPDYLLISLSAQGLALFDKNRELTVIPTRAREVYDVSGAGDTLISAFTLALCAGATSEEAAEIGNHAAGVVVGKVGTVTVSKDELLESFKGGER